MKTKKRVVTYARFSSTNQNESSIIAQQRAMDKYIQDNNYLLVKSYSDEAMTGTNTKRPGFQQMMLDASERTFDILLVHKLDRLSRDVLDTLLIKDELNQYEIKIESVIESYDETPEGEMFQMLQMSMNQYYSRNLAREVMKGLSENAHLCKHNGGIPPLGYKVNPETKQYEIDENEAVIVKIIFQKFIEGYTYKELADYLNLMDYRTKTGSKFSHKSSFYDILINRKYTGEFVYNRTQRKKKQTKRSHRKAKDESEIIRIKGGMPAIIDEESFDKVQEILKQRARTKGSLKAKTTYLLSGIIICDRCGSSFHGNGRKGGRNSELYYSYRCSKRKALLNEEKCSCKELNRDWIDQFVLNQLFTFVLNPINIETFTQAVEQAKNQKESKQTKELPAKKKQLSTVEKQLEKLIDILSGQEMVNMESLVKRIQELEQQKSQLKEEIHQLEQTAHEVEVDITKVRKVMDEAKEHIKNHNDVHLKEVIQQFIKEIRVNDEAIKITYNLNRFFN